MSRAKIQKALISIHAPREGERPTGCKLVHSVFFISIHAPREGERQNKPKRHSRQNIFQSTLPARGSDEAFFKYDSK